VKIALYEMTVTVSYGGIQTSYWETAKRLASRGHEVHMYGGEGGIRWEMPEGVRILTFPFVARNRFPDLGSRFRKFSERLSFARSALAPLIDNRYDVLYIRKSFEMPVTAYVRRKTGAKVVFRSGGTEFYPGYGYFARRLDAFLACSRHNAMQLRRYCGREPEVLYNGVDTERFSPRKKSGQMMGRLGLRDDDFIVMTVGRLVGWKGVQVGIEALSRLTEKKVRYVIVGDGEYRAELDRRARAESVEDRVIFTGAVDTKEMPDIYSVADVVLFPTIGDDDAFPNTLCEAMACGKPAIGTRKGGIPEGIEERETGFVVPARDAYAIVEALKVLICDPTLRESMGTCARARSVEHFSWDVIVERLEEIFHGLRK
jgi:glycosyltransferase involved in cell wall biosynthesis